MKKLFILLLFWTGFVHAQTTKVYNVTVKYPIVAAYTGPNPQGDSTYNLSNAQADSVFRMAITVKADSNRINNLTATVRADSNRINSQSALITQLQQAGTGSTFGATHTYNTSTYILQQGDNNSFIHFTNACKITVSPTLVQPFQCIIYQDGIGTVSFSGSGVHSLMAGNPIQPMLKIKAQNGSVGVSCNGPGIINISGDLKL